MKLSDLRPSPGAKTSARRVGRGQGSGLGQTSGRGHKGLKARSGGGTPPGYEGGQMPLQRRLPKRGFTNVFRKHYAIVRVKDLNRFEPGTVVDLDTLMAAGLVRKRGDGVKLLADGEVDRPLSVKVDKASRSAVKKVTDAGGTVEESSPC